MLDNARRPLYTDFVWTFLGAAARAALEEAMWENFSDEELLKTDFAHRIRLMYFGQLMAPLHRAKGEGRREGKAEALHEALFAVLRTRRIRLTKEQRRTIAENQNRPQLLRWIERAATVSSAGELFAAKRVSRRRVAPR
ncbi:hypothetical protein [Nannocystis pusilla]|uniref:Uncharacterized protein n=1 Tax=Nannocystis pusilla TaxID=889268 RepID=A0ABS7TVA4_9BACT|nr:hypothetical protein [Nannocystis pusilla]MBZ5712193.1 hypothetical protein [Nannocystis pusilla]